MMRLNLLRFPVAPPTNSDFTNPNISSAVHSPGFQVVRGRVRNVSKGILAYLAKAELRAQNSEYDDLRLSWLTVKCCSEIQNYPVLAENAQLIGKRVGEVIWEYAFWMNFGTTFEKAHAYWAERRATNERILIGAVNKKPCGSVPAPTKRKEVACKRKEVA